MVRAAGREQPLGRRLEHQAHAHAHLAQRREIALGHEPGIDVRQQPGLGERRRADFAHIRQRRAVPA